MATQLSLPQRGTAPQFSAHICRGQMAAWIKMPLGMELDLGPGDFVLYRNPAPSPKRGRSPQIFFPCLLGPNRWTDQDGTWNGGRSQPRRLYVRWGPSASLNFRPMFIIVIAISLEHCTVVIGFFKFISFSTPMHCIVRKSLIVLSLFQYKYWSELRNADGFN